MPKKPLSKESWRNPGLWLRNETSKAQDENGETCCEAGELTYRRCFGNDETANLGWCKCLRARLVEY